MDSIACRTRNLNYTGIRTLVLWPAYDVARMSLQDAGAIIERNGFLTLQESASGGGGMVLAAADTLAQ